MKIIYYSILAITAVYMIPYIIALGMSAMYEVKQWVRRKCKKAE